MKGISKEEIEEAIDILFNQDRTIPERIIVMTAYCTGEGGLRKYDFLNMTLCAREDCHTCRGVHKAFVEVVEEQMKRLTS